MNMKKTIAAIAAGAVAVSAMATTVSALEEKTLTYNLVKSIKEDNTAGTITATFTNVPLEAGGKFIVEPKGGHNWDTVVTLSGSFWDDGAGTNKAFTPVVASTMNWEAGWNIEGDRLWNVDPTQNTSDSNPRQNIVTVPIVAGTSAGTNVALKASSSAVITVTVKYTALSGDKTDVGGLNDLINKGEIGILVRSLGSASESGEVKATAAISGKPGVYVKNQDKLNALAGDFGTTLKYDSADNKWKVASTVTLSDNVTFAGNGANAGVGTKAVSKAAAAALAAAAGVNKTGIFTATCTTGGAANTAEWTVSNGTDFTVTAAKDANAKILEADGATQINAVAGDKITFTVDSYIEAGADKTAAVNEALDIIAIIANNDELIITPYKAPENADGVLYRSLLSGAATEASAGTPDKYPYHSSLKNSIYNTNSIGGTINFNLYAADNGGSGDVFNWIGFANDGEKWEFGTNNVQIADAARSVINDAIQNWGDVTFTFNTATQKVKDGKYVEDWVDGALDCRSFGRHFWDRDTGYDANTIYITNDWLGNNLFEGALIINNNLTLSLGATDKFDWTATSLSFSWDAIQDGALTQNQYANYIQNMVLRTSTDWYWDNMTVTLADVEAEEVDTTSPVSADDTDLEEDEEDFGDIDEDEDEDEDETEEPDTEEPETAPVEVASNPGTGNAPVALAVIPVALAAAAIVAKKRG